MAEGAVTLFIEHVKEVVKEFKDLISGEERDELNQLVNDLGSVKAFLHDAATATKTNTGSMFMEIEKQIREFVYEMQDAVDAILTDAYQDSRTNISAKPPLPFSGSKGFSLAKVKSMREYLVLALLKNVSVFASTQIADGSDAVKIPQTMFKRDTPIKQNRKVAVNGHIERTITRQLLEKREKLDLISIIGMPGLGKTTLAWKIYGAEGIRYHFPTRIWVNISQIFDRKDVFLQILKKLTTVVDMSDLDDHKLARAIRSRLEKERFLLVLDDVWTDDDLNEIMQVLPLSNGKAKVLITSLHRDVGMKYSYVYGEPHCLRYLSWDESWELLMHEVFGNLYDCPPKFHKIGQIIARDCNGVPLTVTVVGGILHDQLTKGVPMDEWAELIHALLRDTQGRIEGVVDLSYKILPDYLRKCFLYLGVFPADNYEIPVKVLFRLWIAEGFIQPDEDGRTLEESAEEYMNDLIRMNLLSVEKTSTRTGKVKTCRVHDMIHAFCITKSYEENLFRNIRQSYAGELVPPVSELHEFHLLTFNDDKLSNFLSRYPIGPQVRSFLCFYDQYTELKPEYIAAMLDGFPLLRILEFNCIKLHDFPSKFMKLIHLRYLTLYADSLTILPEAISLLWNLQTLVAETGSHSITMRANIWKMIQLRHLNTNAAVVLDTKWDDDSEAGHNLQTLNRLSVESCTEALSRRAKNLKNLGIYGKLDKFFETKFLEKLHRLENLKLVNSLIYEGLLHGLPRWNCFPPNLKTLTLKSTFLDWQHMSVLATIKSLEALKLKDNAFVGVHWEASGYDFPNLQVLLIVDTDLVIWEASTDSFPSLRYLVLKNCENLIQIPECLGIHLEKLELERLRHSAVESAKRIEETIKGVPKGKFAIEFNLKIGPGCENE